MKSSPHPAQTGTEYVRGLNPYPEQPQVSTRAFDGDYQRLSGDTYRQKKFPLATLFWSGSFGLDVRSTIDAGPHRFCLLGRLRRCAPPMNKAYATDEYTMATDGNILLWRRGDADVDVRIVADADVDVSRAPDVNNQILSKTIVSRIFEGSQNFEDSQNATRNRQEVRTFIVILSGPCGSSPSRSGALGMMIGPR